MKKVNVVEIGPRDGFQSVKEFIPTEIKIQIIDKLVKAGVSKIQASSFISPKAIPQMRDAAEVVETVIAKYPKTHFFALVPNLFGAKAAAAAGLKEISPVLSLSEAHNKANVNRTVEQSLEEVTRIRQELPDIKITQDIATAFACPFIGKMEIPPLIELIGKIQSLGIHSFTLCDTIGMAYPEQIKNVIQAVKKAFPDKEFGLHIHDTRNMGILNSYVGILNGINSVQTTVGGLGGCPFAPGASGNTATEDLVYLLQREGYDTGIDFDLLLDTAKYLKENVVGNYSGHHIFITNMVCNQ
ncbi:MAG: hydroxymethylglutaryl-CoA lyase [Christensenellales bacterium]